METKIFAVKWMSFVIFKFCNGQENENFRKLERTSTGIVPLKSHHRFNETCFNNSLLQIQTNKQTYIYRCVNIYKCAYRFRDFGLL